MQLLTLKDTISITGLSYSYLYEHKRQLGFFQPFNKIKGKWLVEKKVLEERIKGLDNSLKSTSLVEAKCQSKNAVISGTLISKRQMDKELDDLLARKINKKR